MPLYRHSRTHRKDDLLERVIDTEIASKLLRLGFVESETFLFQRTIDQFTESAFINIEPKWFSLDVCSIPEGMKDVIELWDYGTVYEAALVNDLNLTPRGVFKRDQNGDYRFKIENAARRDNSISRAKTAVQEHLETWFKKVRNSQEYVLATSPSSALLYARANELASNSEVATAYYEDEYDVLSQILADCRDMNAFTQEHPAWARQYAYVSKKLGKDASET